MVDENKDALGIARLQVQLENVLAQISIISTNMVTKDLFTAQNAQVEYRFSSLEKQQNDYRNDTIKDVAKVDSDAKARDTAGATEAVRMAKEITDRLDKQDERQFQIEEALKAAKNNRWTNIGVSILSGLVTLVTSVVIIFITRGVSPGN